MADGFSWSAAYGALERFREALDSGGRRSTEEIERELRRRAADLARPIARSQGDDGRTQVLVFALAGERYGIETTRVLEVMPVRQLTAIPGAPARLLGIVNYRGRVLPVIDLRALRGGGEKAPVAGGHIIVASARGMTFGLFCQTVEGSVGIAASDIAAPPLSAAGDLPGLAKGVTADLVAILDADALAQDPRLGINETAR